MPRFPLLTLSAAAAFAVSGCNGPAADVPAAAHDEHAAHDESAHAHPEHGPHGGELVELGEEEYHAEVVHELSKVTVYLLGPDAKTAAPVEASEVTFNLIHDGKPEQFALKPTPQAGDPAGQASKFVSDDEELAKDLSTEVEARLAVTIAGTPYVGKVSHHHGHAHADQAH